MKQPDNKYLYYLKTTDPWAKIFWRVYWWYGVRAARKRRLAKAKKNANMQK
jgi:hypothetical protein